MFNVIARLKTAALLLVSPVLIPAAHIGAGLVGAAKGAYGEFRYDFLDALRFALTGDPYRSIRSAAADFLDAHIVVRLAALLTLLCVPAVAVWAIVEAVREAKPFEGAWLVIKDLADAVVTGREPFY